MSIKITPVKAWRRRNDITGLLGKKGIITSFTIVRAGPVGFSHYTPYPVVMVELGNNQRLLGQLTDYGDDDVKIGKKVVAVLRRLRTEGKKDVISYVIKFRPL